MKWNWAVLNNLLGQPLHLAAVICSNLPICPPYIRYQRDRKENLKIHEDWRTLTWPKHFFRWSLLYISVGNLIYMLAGSWLVPRGEASPEFFWFLKLRLEASISRSVGLYFSLSLIYIYILIHYYWQYNSGSQLRITWG